MWRVLGIMFILLLALAAGALILMYSFGGGLTLLRYQVEALSSPPLMVAEFECGAGMQLRIANETVVTPGNYLETELPPTLSKITYLHVYLHGQKVLDFSIDPEHPWETGPLHIDYTDGEFPHRISSRALAPAISCVSAAGKNMGAFKVFSDAIASSSLMMASQ